MGEGDRQYRKFKGFKWTVGDEDVPALALVVDHDSKLLHICEPADVLTDWALAKASHPTVCIHSATDPATEYIKMYHDATNAYIDGVGATAINFQIAGTTEISLAAAGLDMNSNNITEIGALAMATAVELTIAAGVVTATQSYHTVDTEADAATDDLDTINGGVVGNVLVITASNSARTIRVKHNTGNIQLDGYADFNMTHANTTLVLFYNGTNWLQLCKSSNGI